MRSSSLAPSDRRRSRLPYVEVAISVIMRLCTYRDCGIRQAEETRMRLIWAVIQPTKLKSVEKALLNIGVTRMTVLDAMGYARQRGHIETYRGHEYETNLLRKVQLEIAVNEDFLDKTIECLEEHARTSIEGHIGDGKVFVLPMDQAIQISDGQRGPGAV
jgi:nitrogen regulatory protein P-II 2